MTFPEDLKEAGLLYEKSGYYFVALPERFGKRTNSVLQTHGYLHNFPAASLTSKFNIHINHYKSETLSIDIDDYEQVKKILSKRDIDIEKYLDQTMAAQGRENHYKLFYKKPYKELTLNRCSIKTDSQESILTFKGANLPEPATYMTLNNYFDMLPPSKNPESGNLTRFITDFRIKDDLPTMPDDLFELWVNFKDYEDELCSQVLADK